MEFRAYWDYYIRLGRVIVRQQNEQKIACSCQLTNKLLVAIMSKSY